LSRIPHNNKGHPPPASLKIRMSANGRAILSGGPVRQLTRAPTNKGHKYITGIIRNMVLVNSGFLHAKEFI
jgi:hypothetical protein